MMTYLFEQLLREADKSRFINKLYDEFSVDDKIKNSDTENRWVDRGSMIAFVNSKNQFTDKMDWNKATSSDRDIRQDFLSELFSYYKEWKNSPQKIANDAKRNYKKDPYELFKFAMKDNLTVVYDGDCSGADIKVLKDLDNEKFMFASPLTYEGAVWMDSFACGGQGAKWCIGYEQDPDYWNEHVKDYGELFILAIRKSELIEQKEDQTLKYMIQISSNSNETQAWCQEDDPKDNIPMNKLKRVFGWNPNEILEVMASEVLCDDTDYSVNSYDWINEDLDVVRPFREDVLVDNTLYLSDFIDGKYQNNKQAIYDAWYSGVELDCEGQYLYLKDIIGKEPYGGNKDSFDMPQFLDWLAECGVNNINSVTISNAKIENFVWEPEASSNKSDIYFENCDILNFYHIDFQEPSRGMVAIYFNEDHPSKVHELHWACSENTEGYAYNYRSFVSNGDVTVGYEYYDVEDEDEEY